jgi:hypothetical protein
LRATALMNRPTAMRCMPTANRPGYVLPIAPQSTTCWPLRATSHTYSSVGSQRAPKRQRGEILPARSPPRRPGRCGETGRAPRQQAHRHDRREHQQRQIEQRRSAEKCRQQVGLAGPGLLSEDQGQDKHDPGIQPNSRTWYAIGETKNEDLASGDREPRKREASVAGSAGAAGSAVAMLARSGEAHPRGTSARDAAHAVRRTGRRGLDDGR